MSLAKRFLVISLSAGTLFMTSSCADDNLAKGLITGAGAAGGAYIGAQLSGPGQKLGGAVLGAGAGGVLGYLLGGAIGKK